MSQLSNVKIVDSNTELIFVKGENLTNSIYSYRVDEPFVYVTYKNSEKVYPYSKEKIQIVYPYRESEDEKSPFEFIKNVVSIVGLKNDIGHNLLRSQFEKINFIRCDSILAAYLSGNFKDNHYKKDETTIFPFSFNLSQKEAVNKALSNKISIIEGPPGTGKTQTILNIIANAVMRGESVAVVSNNNSAVNNILEKLTNHKIDFIGASLGKVENKENFINNQILETPNMEGWELSKNALEKTTALLNDYSKEISKMLEIKNKTSKYRAQLDEIVLVLILADADSCSRKSRTVFSKHADTWWPNM